MKDIREIYPNCVVTSEWGDEYFERQGDYDPLLESFEYEILLKIDDNDYSGDSRLILRDKNKYGILIFGWGSCSGCDALLACESYEEIESLRQYLKDSIKWFDSPEELLQFMKTHDWKGDFSWWSARSELEEFIKKSIKLLKKIIRKHEKISFYSKD